MRITVVPESMRELFACPIIWNMLPSFPSSMLSHFSHRGSVLTRKSHGTLLHLSLHGLHFLFLLETYYSDPFGNYSSCLKTAKMVPLNPAASIDK